MLANLNNIESVVKRRAGHVLVSYESNLYMWGGYMEKEHEETYNLMTRSNAQYHRSDEIWIYSYLLNIWRKKKCTGDIPFKLSGSCAEVIDNCMYLFGGFNDDLIEENINLLWRLDLRTFIWKLLNPSGFEPFASEMCASWVYCDRFYIFGGYGPRNNSRIESASVKVTFDSDSSRTSKGWFDQLVFYDSSCNYWIWPIAKGSKPCPRAAHSATVLGNKAFLFGGRSKENRLNDFHCFEMKIQCWSEVQINESSEFPIGRSWHSLNAVSVDKILLYGGFSFLNQVLNDCWIAQINSSSEEKIEVIWKELELPYDHGEPRCNHCAALINEGQLVIVSGLTQPYYLKMYLLVEHAEETLRLNLSPPSLFELTLEYISISKYISRKSWSHLTNHIRRILEARTNPLEIHGN